MKKIFFLLLTFLLSLSTVFGFNINIEGKITEYGPYEESLFFNLSCDEQTTFALPSAAINPTFENKSPILNLNSVTIDGCSGSQLVNYYINAIEKENNIIRIERKFPHLNQVNFSYALTSPFEFTINENETIPKEYTTKYSTKNKTTTFEQSDVYLIYLKKEELEENSLAFHKLLEELTES